ncbi:MAG: divalent metal cation transporter [Planctomycetota bacterium]|nr:MAG: divalent metal cation transporter [Planctomycetota bacterium]
MTKHRISFRNETLSCEKHCRMSDSHPSTSGPQPPAHQCDARSAPLPRHRPWYRRIGPGLITACVVIGPGSIMTSSQVGATYQYSMLWVVVISVAFMMLFMSMGARLGAVADAAPGDLIRRKAGSWLAICLGLGVFFIAAAFQSGNNIGVASAFAAWTDSRWLVAGLVMAMNALAIAFLFVFQNLYRAIERLMTAFVGVMLVCFAINLVRLKPDVVAMLKGLVPSFGKSGDMLPLLGLVGTTLVITAAFYQAYLVRQKGWKREDLADGLLDARIGSVIMFLITMMLMSTAAAGLHTGQAVALKDPVAVATALEGTFGPSAKLIFCLGLFSAAYSSFLVNSMVGGFVAADGLGWGNQPKDLGPRLMTTAALVVGMLVGVAVLAFDFDRTPTIILAQAVTVVAAPLVAGVLLWLTSSRDVMGEEVNGWPTIVAGMIGLGLLLAMAGKTALVDLPAKVQSYTAASQQQSAQ